MTDTTASQEVHQRYAPGPKGSFIFGNLKRMRSDPLGLFMDAFRDFGDIVRLRLIFNVHLIIHPDHVRRVLQGEHSHKYKKGKLYDRIKPLIGEGLLASEGHHWIRQRRLIQPAFRPRSLSVYAEIMQEESERMLRKWETLAKTRAEFKVSDEMTEVTLRIIGRTMLSIDLESSVDSVLANLPTVLTTLNERFQQILYAPFLLTPANRRFNKALGALDTVVHGVINERKATGLQNDDFLSTLISARDEAGNGMTPKQLRDEVMTMLLAGHETTSNALSWTLSLLAEHQDIQDEVRREAQSALGSDTSLMTMVRSLSYTKMVFQESMRLYPPVWILGRSVVEDDRIDGYRIPKGSAVLLSPFVTHRHPAIWERPNEFDPSRFHPEHAENRPQFSYFPFSGGPRTCIGDRFSLMEGQVVLANILSRYRILPGTHGTVIPEPSVTLRPKGGVHIRIARV